MTLALLVGLLLSQAEEGPVDAGSVAPAAPRAQRAGDELTRLLKQLPELAPPERAKAMAEIQRLYGAGASGPLLPPADVDLLRYTGLAAVDQARIAARTFIEDLILGDAGALVGHCGLPFMLEDRKIERAEDLRAEWARSLSTQRTDLLKLHDIEMFSPAEMEKKHGPPPRRLQGWPIHSGQTFLAVANLSGRAAVLLLRQAGATWQIVGYHD